MKKLVIVFALAAMLAGCGGDVVNGVHYNSYGIVTEEAQKNPNIQYEVSALSVIFAIILVETVVVPVYVIGWDLFKPVGLKIPSDPSLKGTGTLSIK